MAGVVILMIMVFVCVCMCELLVLGWLGGFLEFFGGFGAYLG